MLTVYHVIANVTVGDSYIYIIIRNLIVGYHSTIEMQPDIMNVVSYNIAIWSPLINWVHISCLS